MVTNHHTTPYPMDMQVAADPVGRATTRMTSMQCTGSACSSLPA